MLAINRLLWKVRIFTSPVFIFILPSFECLFKWRFAWLILIVSDGGLHFLLCICFIVNNCLICLLTSFFKVLSVFPKLARRIIKLSKYSTVFHMIKHIKKPHQLTPDSSPAFPSPPFPSLASFPFSALCLPPAPFSPFSASYRPVQGVPFAFSCERACCLDLGAFVFLFCLLPYFRGAYVLEVSRECTYKGEVLMWFFFLIREICFCQSSMSM